MNCPTQCLKRAAVNKNPNDRDIKLEIFSSIKELKATFEFEKSQNIFRSVKYWAMLNTVPPQGIQQYFTVASYDDDILGIFYFQVVPFHMKDHLQYKYSQNASKWKRFKDLCRGLVASMVNIKMLVTGNMLHTGDFGVSWKSDLEDETKQSIWGKAIETTWQSLEKTEGNITICLAKDFEPSAHNPVQVFKKNNYSLYRFQPAMHLHLKEDWQNMDDYLAAISSKYRVRYRRARKKLNGVEKRELSLSDLKHYKKEIFQLYKNIADTVEFNLFYLHEDYYIELKRQYADKCTVFGYFHEDKLVGFVPVLDNDGTLEGLFLGFEEKENYKFHLYHNYLFDILEEAIKRRCHTIDYARTALEIKSSIGAVPHDLDCYIKHRSAGPNKLIHRAISYFTPIYKWEQRKPFKG